MEQKALGVAHKCLILSLGCRPLSSVGNDKGLLISSSLGPGCSGCPSHARASWHAGLTPAAPAACCLQLHWSELPGRFCETLDKHAEQDGEPLAATLLLDHSHYNVFLLVPQAQLAARLGPVCPACFQQAPAVKSWRCWQRAKHARLTLPCPALPCLTSIPFLTRTPLTSPARSAGLSRHRILRRWRGCVWTALCLPGEPPGALLGTLCRAGGRRGGGAAARAACTRRAPRRLSCAGARAPAEGCACAALQRSAAPQPISWHSSARVSGS